MPTMEEGEDEDAAGIRTGGRRLIHPHYPNIKSICARGAFASQILSLWGKISYKGTPNA